MYVGSTPDYRGSLVHSYEAELDQLQWSPSTDLSAASQQAKLASLHKQVAARLILAGRIVFGSEVNDGHINFLIHVDQGLSRLLLALQFGCKSRFGKVHAVPRLVTVAPRSLHRAFL